MKKKTKKPSLPKVLFVAHKRNGPNDGPDDDYFIAEEDTRIFDDGDVVGRYELVKVGKKCITHTLE